MLADCVADHLHSLAVQGKLAFGGALQIVARRPGEVVETGVIVDVAAHRPDVSGFLLGLVETTAHGG